MRLARSVYPKSLLVALSGMDDRLGLQGDDWLLPDDLEGTVQEELNGWLLEAGADVSDVVGHPDEGPGAERPAPRGLAALAGAQPTRQHLPALNHYRTAEIEPGLHFVSVDTGRWMLLDDADCAQLRSGELPTDELARRLEHNFVLLTERNVDEYTRRLSAHYSFLTWGPTLHILVVTRRCNLRCVYCQAGSGPERSEQMTPETACAAVERAFESPAHELTLEFQGGEPLLAFPAVRAAAERALELANHSSRQVRLSLVSNFTESASEEKLRYLVHRGFNVSVSLDGPADLHDRNRGVGRQTCFEVVEANIRNLQRIWREERSGYPDLGALLTTTRASLNRCKEIVDTYLALGLNEVGIRAVAPIGRGRQMPADQDYSVAEFLDFWKDVVAYVLDLRKQGHDVRESSLELILRKLFGRDTSFMDLRSPCGAAHGQVVYDTDGSVHTCDEARMVGGERFRLGNIELPLAALMRAPTARRTVAASIIEQYWCDHCAFAPFCGVCPVLHHLEAGALVTDVLQQRRCAIQMGMIRYVLELFVKDPVARGQFAAMAQESFER